jgi:hypothetical protein
MHAKSAGPRRTSAASLARLEILPRRTWAQLVVERHVPSHPFSIDVDVGDGQLGASRTSLSPHAKGPAMEILDQLEMLVTSDPAAELDDALSYAATRLRTARISGDAERARCILAWIDHRLDERLAFQHKLGADGLR